MCTIFRKSLEYTVREKCAIEKSFSFLLFIQLQYALYHQLYLSFIKFAPVKNVGSGAM